MKPIYHAIRLDRGCATPLCHQIKDYLMQYIRSGELPDGEMLPPEEELCVLLNVSRPTVRQALTDLVHEGYLNRVKFKGTFVTRPRLAGKFIQTIQTYDEEIQSMGLTPSTKVISLISQEAGDDVRRALHLKQGERVVFLERLRCAQNQPVVYVKTYLPEKSCKGILEEDMQNNSLYQLLERKYAIDISHLSRNVRAALPDSYVADLLKLPETSAVLYVSTTSYTQDDVPFEYSLASYRGDMYQMNVDLKKS